MEIITELTINAPAQKIWQALMDFPAYPQWNPFLTRIEGDQYVGGNLAIEIKPSEKETLKFRPVVLKSVEAQEFSWLGIVGSRWIFSGEHYFILQDLGGNQTKLIHGEKFGGLLLPVFCLLSAKKTRIGFEKMNQALKIKVERNS